MVSFPLIGIDVNGNQREFEYSGSSAQKAAETAAQMFGYAQVLSGDKGRKMLNYRRPLFKSDARNGPFTRPKSALALLLEDPFLKTGPAILQHLRDKGFEVSLVQGSYKNGDPWTKIKLTPLPQCKVKLEDRQALRNFIEPNNLLIVSALEAEARKSGADAKKDESADVLKGKKQRDVVLSMLPQLPTPFPKKHLIDRLREAGFPALAADSKRVQNMIVYCLRPGGEVTSAGWAKYQVLEEFRHRRHSPEPELPVPEEVPTVEPVAQPQPDVPPAAVQAPPATEPPALPPQVSVNALTAAVIDLASHAMASGNDDTGQIAARLEEACKAFETTVLEAVTALMADVRPVLERLTKQASARQALVRSLIS